MGHKELESFKIAETRKPGVSSPRKTGSGAPVDGTRSLGFKRIEGLLEREDRAAVQASLDEVKQRLTELARTARSGKTADAANKAIAAVDRAAGLMGFLFDTKDSLAGTGRP